MKIISWNVNGIRACAEKGFLTLIESEDPDILTIQETKAHPDQLSDELRRPDQRVAYFSSAARKGYSGVATFLKTPADAVEMGIGIRKFDSEGRFLITHHPDFTLYNVYFPNGGSGQERHDFKQDFLKRFSKHLAKKISDGEEIILVGDYNVAYLKSDVFDPVTLSEISGYLPEEREWFQEFLNVGFIDTYRYFHPEEKDKYTWWSYKERARAANRGWRIDHICVSKGLEKRLRKAEVMDHVMGSDHCPVLLELD